MSLRPISVDFVSKWHDLSEVCRKVIRCESISREKWNDSFVDVYGLCVSRPDPHAPKLYEETALLIQNCIYEIADNLSQLQNEFLLPAYVQNWERFYCGLGYLDRLFGCVNTQYVRTVRPTEADMCYGVTLTIADKHHMEILELGLSHWKTYLIEPLQPRLTACLLQEVNYDRIGSLHQQSSIVPCIESFLRVDELKGLTRVSIDVYRQIFELPLIEDTKMHFINWTDRMQVALSCTEYVTQALALRKEETERAERYYNCSLKCINLLFTDIIVQQRYDFINSSVPKLIQENNKGALKNTFQLLSPTNQCSEILKYFGAHVKYIVTEIISNLPSDQNLAPTYFVDNILAIRNAFVDFIDEVFDGMSTFRNEMDKAFDQAINSNQIKSTGFQSQSPFRAAEHLSRYVDALLRKPTKQLTEGEIENKLTSAISLFKYIEEKDVFRKYYQRNLCFRLLFISSTILELEESAINQLNAVCGYEFTSKFQRMFNDIQLSPEANVNYQRYLVEQNKKFTFTHHFNILTLSAWPIYLKNAMTFSLPSQLAMCNSCFESFYQLTFNGRRLCWAHSHSFMELRMCYADKPYILNLASLHGSILLLFEDLGLDSLSVRDIANMLQNSTASANNNPISAESNQCLAIASVGEPTASTSSVSSSFFNEMIKRCIVLLVEANILKLKSQTVSQLTEDTIVELNYNFTYKRLKVKINIFPQFKEPIQGDADQMEKEVDEDRRFFTQAAIVRLMKSRKTCQHSTLIEGVVALAKGRFELSKSLIKRSIESLIEKGYLERNPNMPDQYNYMA